VVFLSGLDPFARVRAKNSKVSKIWDILICKARIYSQNLLNMQNQNILFSTLMFMSVVSAILTRNERYCSRFRNTMSFVYGLMIIVLIVL